MSRWREFFSWLKEPDSWQKISVVSTVNSLWFLTLYGVWYFGFFLNGNGFLGLLGHFWGWLLLLGVIVLPSASLLALGYFKRYALALMVDDLSALPPLEEPAALFQAGLETFALFLIVFSPSFVSVIFAVGSFWGLVHGDVSGSLLRALLSIFFLFLALVFSFLSSVIFPVCFFRQMEERDLRWALVLSDIWKDGVALGMPFWRIFFSSAAIYLMGETVLFLTCILLAVSPVGVFLSGSFFILISSFLVSILAVSGLRQGVVCYKELHYNY